MIALTVDTSLGIERLQIDGLRQMPAWRKAELLAAMSRAVRTPALGGRRFPQDTPAQRRRRLPEGYTGRFLKWEAVYVCCQVEEKPETPDRV